MVDDGEELKIVKHSKNLRRFIGNEAVGEKVDVDKKKTYEQNENFFEFGDASCYQHNDH